MLSPRTIGVAIRRFAGAFRRDRRGVSALEFALIAPIMITIYIGTGVLCEAMMAQRRTSHIASAVGDLVGQQPTLASGYVSTAFTAANVIMAPYPTAGLQLRVTSITRNSSGANKVDWSCGQSYTPYPVGAVITTVPAGLLANTGDNILFSEAKYAYASPTSYVLPSTLNFADNFYLKPRGGTTLAAPASC